MAEYGSESSAPGEDGSGATDKVSEQAREQSFAASQAAAAQQAKDEKRAKKRDNGVAQMILQFLNDEQRTHLAVLIARLVAMDCPTTFILAVLALISEGSKTAVDEYLKEQNSDATAEVDRDMQTMPSVTALDATANRELVIWIVRMERVLAVDSTNVLKALLVNDQNIDGTVLQLTTFALQEYLQSHQKNVAFEQLQQLAIGVLQSIFSPYLQAHLASIAVPQDEDEE